MNIKIFLIGLLITQFCGAQIINFPDANLKAKLLSANTSNFVASYFWTSGGYLVSVKIDINNDGEIQQSEALLIENLSVGYSSITNLFGIEYFTRLKSLDISGNLIQTINPLGINNLLTLRIKSCKKFNFDI